ncbi:MAG: polysaccharide deacetylase family protein [Archangium sp.]
MRHVLWLVLCAGCVTVPPPRAGFDVALTVDDLPLHGPLSAERPPLDIAERFIAVLRAHGVRGVYGFTNGSRVEPGTEPVLTAWVKAGHHLSNHTWSHGSLNRLSAEEFLADASQNEQLLAKYEPDATARLFFRYPFLFEGDTLEKREAVRRGLFERGFKLAHVSIDADDWAFNPPFVRCLKAGEREKVAELRKLFIATHLDEWERMRALSKSLTQRDDVPQVLLLHLGAGDAEFLDELLTAFEQRGARWVSLDRALADPFYGIDPALAQKSGAAFPYRVAKARAVSVDAPIYARGLEERLETFCEGAE